MMQCGVFDSELSEVIAHAETILTQRESNRILYVQAPRAVFIRNFTECGNIKRSVEDPACEANACGNSRRSSRVRHRALVNAHGDVQGKEAIYSDTERTRFKEKERKTRGVRSREEARKLDPGSACSHAIVHRRIDIADSHESGKEREIYICTSLNLPLLRHAAICISATNA